MSIFWLNIFLFNFLIVVLNNESWTLLNMLNFIVVYTWNYRNFAFKLFEIETYVNSSRKTFRTNQ